MSVYVVGAHTVYCPHYPNYNLATLPKGMKITKVDGTHEEFKTSKLIGSLKKAGARPDEIRSIVSTIEASLHEGAETQAIYKHAFGLLRGSNTPVAARYSLRRAIFGLGPTGFPFEDFLGKLFEAEGYRTKRRLILRGKCATHEIDLAAYSPSHSFVAEAKFHMHPGVKSDLQVAMYSYARYLDLESARICPSDTCGIIDLMVITNTKFTRAAIDYAKCAGVRLMSWDYPKNDSLHDRIERLGLYPITVLTTLSAAHKQKLLMKGTILCSDILRRPHSLNELALSPRKVGQILDEVTILCGVK